MDEDQPENEESMKPIISVTAMRTNPYYSIYYINLGRLLVLGIIPLGLLVFFNCDIYKRIKSRSTLTEENVSKGIKVKQENELARVLFAIVILFILCHALRVVLNFYEMIWINKAISCMLAGQPEFPRWSVIVNEFSRFLMVFNSSVNIVMYCCFNTKFRKRALRYRNTITNKLSTTKTPEELRGSDNNDDEDMHNDTVQLQSIRQKVPAY